MRRDLEPWEILLIREMDTERMIASAEKQPGAGKGDKDGNVVYWTEAKDIRAALMSAGRRKRPERKRRRPA